MTITIAPAHVVLQAVMLPDAPSFPPLTGQREPYRCEVQVAVLTPAPCERVRLVRTIIKPGFILAPVELRALARLRTPPSIRRQDELRNAELARCISCQLPQDPPRSDEALVQQLMTRLYSFLWSDLCADLLCQRIP